MGIFDRWAKRIGERAAKDAWEQQKPAIHKAVVEALEPALKKAVGEIVAEYYRKSPRFRFIKYMQAEMERVDPTMNHKASFEAARDALNEYLRDEGVQFGDSQYAWDKGGAIDVIHGYEIDHWERAG